MKQVLFSFVILLASCSEKQEEIKPIRKSITESIYASGSIESKNQYTAFASASGIVNEIYHSDGDDILKGAPVLSISSIAQQLNKDNASLLAAFSDLSVNQGKLREAKQRIELARSKMMNDSIQLLREKKLKDKNIGLPVQYEAAELTFANSKISYTSALENYAELKRQLDLNAKQAKNNLKIANTLQNDYTLRSSLNGTVYAVNVEVGEIVTPQTPIAVLGEKNSFVLKMQVDEYDINRIEKGQKVMVVINTDRDKVYEAKITRVYPMMNLQSKTFLVEADWVTRPKKVYPNVSFEANIVVQTKNKALLIPRDLLVDKTFVINSDGKKIKVKTGLMDFNFVEIVSGLDEKCVLIRSME